MFQRRASFVALLLLVITLAAPLAARTYTIVLPADAVAADGWCTLREALRAAAGDVAVNECPAGELHDEIRLLANPEITYPFADGEETLAGFPGTITLRSTAASGYGPTIDLQASNRFLTLGIEGRMEIRGLVIANGVAVSAAGGGGLLRVLEASLTLDTVRLEGGTSGAGGGCLEVLISDAGNPLTLRGVELVDCWASGQGGGAKLRVGGSNPVVLDRVTVEDATGDIGFAGVPVGGGLHMVIRDGSDLVWSRSRLERNRAFHAESAAPAAAFFLSVEGSSSTATIRDLSWADNEGTSAAKLAAIQDGEAYLDRAAGRGGTGTLLEVTTSQTVHLTNLLLVGGSQDGLVGTAQSESNLVTRYLTVADNAGNGVVLSETGGGVGGASLLNSIVTGNGVAGNGAADLVTDPGVLVAWTSTADPLFVDRANGDYHLAATSPAIDGGSAFYGGGLENDLDGGARRLLDEVDLGAYEWGNLFADGFESGDTSAWSGGS